MIPTPADVLPVVTSASGDLRDALRKGVAYADELQPNRNDRDPWFWSHSARHMARKQLFSANPQSGVEGYEMRGGVPNGGIHLRFHDMHVARVVRSLGGTTPAPGSNPARRRAWNGVEIPIQGQLALADNVTLPPLSLIIDWQDVDGEPLIHISLPRGEWAYRKSPRLYWRVPLPDDGVDLNALRFDGSDDGFGEALLDFEIDAVDLSVDGG